MQKSLNMDKLMGRKKKKKKTHLLREIFSPNMMEWLWTKPLTGTPI